MVDCYVGYIESEDILSQTSSGGIATALSQEIIRGGGVVYGVRYSDDFRNVIYTKACSQDELKFLMGSKYVKANVGGVLSELIYDLQSGKNVLFIGLPCDTFVVKKKIQSLGIDKNLIIVDIICSGVVSKSVLKDFVCFLERKYKASVTGLSMRKKLPYWIPPFFYAVFDNGKVYKERLYRTDFGIALSNMLCEGCYHCSLRNENRCSDITIGDAWGIQKSFELYNSKGVSVFVSNSEKGDNLIKKLTGIKYIRYPYDDMMRGNPRYSTHASKNDSYKNFVNTYTKKGLHRACMESMSTKSKIIYSVRRLFSVLR